MNQDANQLDYNSSGFDNFLSRSIDDLQQANLDAAGPKSNQLSFDRSQMNGSLGDRVRVGNITLDGKDESISMSSDGRLKSLLIGRDSRNQQVVKVAKEGFDAKDARDDQLIFNSLQNTLKIIKTDIVNVPVGTATVNWTTIPHNLGFVPGIMAYLNNVGLGAIASAANMPLPTYTNATVDPGVQVQMLTWFNAVVDDTNIYIICLNATGAAFNFNVKYYLLQESANG